jgi:uncharacterized protein YifE (UPF0438 family)
MFLVGAATAVLLARPAFADDPIRVKADLERALAAIVTDLVEKHVALAKKLEKPGCLAEARLELELALELDTDAKTPREKLGYKREGDAWLGTPGPVRSRVALEAGLLWNERDRLHKDAATRLAALAKRAQAGGLASDARAVAGLALEEDATSKAAREVLGHEKHGDAWASARETKIATAFGKAHESASSGEVRPGAEDEELTKLLGLGELVRRETDHAVYFATKDADADLAGLAKVVAVTSAAYRHYLGSGDPGFAIEGETDPPAAAAPPIKERSRVRWLVVAAAEHAKFLDKAVLDKSRHDLAKKLRSWSGWLELPSGKIFVFESCLATKFRAEWISLSSVKTLSGQTLAANKAAPPAFIVEGFARFFGGRASGKVEISYVSAKESSAVHERAAATFDEFRARVRPTLTGALDGDLRRLVTKHLNELEDPDSALAFAFVEFAFACHRAELKQFLEALKPDEEPLTTFERVFQRNVEAIEREFRAWAREEY